MRDKHPDDRVRCGRQPHRRGLQPHDRTDERAESPLGRLYLRRLIDDDAYNAGGRYAAIVGAYRAVIEAPSGTAGSGRGSFCATEEADNALLCRIYPDACGCLRRKQRYDRAFEALCTAGQRAAKAVARLAVHGEELAREDLVYLKLGLRQLALHFGLTRRRARIDSGNTH